MVAEKLKYSQNGEEGIVVEIFKRLKITGGTCCEFGNLPSHTFSNTQYFIEKGFEGYLFDKDYGYYITPENVNDIVPDELTLLSIDIDGNDYAVWQAYKGSADVVIIEINSSLGEEVHSFSLSEGCSYAKMNQLAKDKGYHLVFHTGNCIYVKQEYAHLFTEPVIFNNKWYENHKRQMG